MPGLDGSATLISGCPTNVPAIMSSPESTVIIATVMRTGGEFDDLLLTGTVCSVTRGCVGGNGSI